LSAFFAGSETALTVASRPAMHQLEQKGSRSARIVNRLNEKKGDLISSLLIGNNIVVILSSAFATSTLTAMFGEAGVAYATALMTVLIVLFAEILPKSYALHHANRIALVLAPVVQPVVWALTPVTWAANKIVRGALFIFGVKLTANETVIPSSEELRGAIELHESADASADQERKMLHSILDLAEVEVGEIMIHRSAVVRICADDPPQRILEQMLASSHTRIPLYRGEPDNVIGVLHARDILRALRDAGGNAEGIDAVALATPPWFVPETTTLLDQLHAFRAKREHFAIVIDEYGALLGVLTLEDIIEEIIGEIGGEGADRRRPGLRPQPDGSVIVDGQYTIRDLNRRMEWRLPDENAATVAGLVLHEARRIPDAGQTFRFYGFRFEILRRQRHRVTALRVTPPQQGELD
jgi:Mg2+/Co2+ transporter CorB